MRAIAVIAAGALLASAAVADARPAPARCGGKVAKQVRARTTLCLTRSAPKARRPPSRDTSAGGGPLRDGGATPQAPGATAPTGGPGEGQSAPSNGGQSGDGDGTPELNALGVRAYDRSGVFTLDSTRSTVRAGALTVSFRNDDSDEHNLWIEGTSPFVGPVRLVDDLAGGAHATATTTLSAGAYRLFCTVPGHSSMTRTLTVSG